MEFGRTTSQPSACVELGWVWPNRAAFFFFLIVNSFCFFYIVVLDLIFIILYTYKKNGMFLGVT